MAQSRFSRNKDWTGPKIPARVHARPKHERGTESQMTIIIPQTKYTKKIQISCGLGRDNAGHRNLSFGFAFMFGEGGEMTYGWVLWSRTYGFSRTFHRPVMS